MYLGNESLSRTCLAHNVIASNEHDGLYVDGQR